MARSGGAPIPEAGASHALDSSKVLERLRSGPAGLEPGEASVRLERHGPNRLPPPRRASSFGILLDQFASVVVLLLAAAGAVAFLMGDSLEAAAVAGVLVINTGIGFAVELRARRAMEALLRYEVPWARVIRSGAAERIPADQVVPGDVIEVGEGDAVPADARLLEGADLRVTEASLTGESIPVEKDAEPVSSDAPLAERTSMVYAGTTAVSGRGRAVVVATGQGTELGRIGVLLESVEEGETPLQRRLDALGLRLVWLTLGVAAAVVATGALQGAPIRRMVETGIALAIAAVPEGLPAVATIALAVGLRRMAARHALVRRLHAVEALGSTTVVCTDKTGTLTAGQMTVVRLVGKGMDLEVTGSGFGIEGSFLRDGEPVDPEDEATLELLLWAAGLSSRATLDSGTGVTGGDPTDVALLVLARKGGRDPRKLESRFPRVGEIPFSSQRKAGASIHRREEGTVAWVKGAPDVLLDSSSTVAAPGGHQVSLDPETRRTLEAANDEMAGEGLRVVALATGECDREAEEIPNGLTFLALVGIIDPPAEGVRETIDRLRAAGIRTVMITGDQRATAEAVARDLAVLEEGEETLEGRQVAAMDLDALSREVGRVGVYSRISPEDKLRIVTSLQSHGEIVAMLGDGVNDAAALKKSDVGVAMGIRGTDVAKETAALVLQDDRFPTIGAAVEEGRVIFDNIRKFVFYLFSCNLAEILVLLVSSIAGLPMPLLPLQILWLNLVTDTFPALALAMEPGEPDIMRRPPRHPDAAILTPSFLRPLVFFSALITVSTLAAYLWAIGSGRSGEAVTISFMTLALAQLFHVGNARSHGPVVHPRRIVANPWALGAVPLVVGLQVLSVHWSPLQRVLGTTPLDPVEWGVVVALAAVPAVIGQGIEWLQERSRSG